MCLLRSIAVAFALLCGTAWAQGYPSKTVRLVVPYPPGGSTDIVARVIAQKLTQAWGQPVVVENRSGGGTVIGTDAVAKALPDGYTLLIAPAPFTINPSLMRKLPYDTLADFAPVTLVYTTPLVLVVNPNLAAKSVGEFIALAKTKPRQLNFGSSGTGGSNHLAGELFNAMAGVEMVHIPYKGNAPALADLAGGHVDAVFNGLTSAVALVRSAKLRALAVTSRRRAEALPEIPTLDESGLKGFEAVAWSGIVAPAGTPHGVIARIHAEVKKIVHTAEFRERLKEEGSDPVGNAPDEYAAFLREEVAKWAKVIRFAGVKAD